jgi:hypothetical protein
MREWKGVSQLHPHPSYCVAGVYSEGMLRIHVPRIFSQGLELPGAVVLPDKSRRLCYMSLAVPVMHAS